MSNLLFIVDLQNDFVSGSLAVPDAQAAVEEIERLVTSRDYDYIYASKDWHPINHISFSDDPQFVDKSWPVHCVAGTLGAQFASGKVAAAVDKVFLKGRDPQVEAYSAFDGAQAPLGYTLEDALEDLIEDLDRFDIVGLALDYCVQATALDAAARGFPPTVLAAATRPVTLKSGMLAVQEMALSGVIFE